MEPIFNKKDYIYGFKLNLNLDVLYNSCIEMLELRDNILSHPVQSEIKKLFLEEKNKTLGRNKELDERMSYLYHWKENKGYGYINMFTYAFSEFHNLHSDIKNCFSSLVSKDQNYFIDGWPNAYYKNKNDHHDWHMHYHEKLDTWHGVFYVNANDSITRYMLPNTNEVIDIECENNVLVLVRGGGDRHRSLPWTDPKKPRVTVGLNIVPEKNINPRVWFNYWAPL